MRRGPETNRNPLLLILGPNPEARGGVAHSIAAESQSCLRERFEIRILPTMDRTSVARKLLIAADAFLRLIGLLVCRKVDLAYLHYGDGPSFLRKIPFMIALWVFRVPYVVKDHSNWIGRIYPQYGPIRRRLAAFVLNRASAVLVLSQDWKAVYESLLRRPVPVEWAPNGVDTRRFAFREPRTDAQAISFLSLGLLARHKGAYDLLDVAQLLSRNNTAFHLVIAGNGEVDEVREEAHQRGLGEHVTCPGWLEGDAVNRALAEADVFVLASHREGMPLSVMQAMSVGMPIVASRVGGVPLLVRDGENGFLVEAKDIEGFASRMQQLAGDAELRVRMSRESRRIAENELDLDRLAVRLAEVFERAMSPTAK